MAKVKKNRSETVDLETKLFEPQKTTDVPLVDIVSNEAQSRGMGVLSRLQDMGFGIFEQASDDKAKKPIWELLASEAPEDRKHAVALIEDNEPELIKAAESQRKSGQIQPIGVRRLDGGLDVIYGMRRALARMFNFAKYGNKVSDTVKANVYDQDFTVRDLKLMAYEENDNRLDESPIDRAIFYKSLMDNEGLDGNEVGKMINMSGQHVRDYVKLLHKKLENKRMAIHLRQLGVEPALKLLKKLQGGTDANRNSTEGKRDRLPGSKGLIKLYNLKEKPKDMDAVEWNLWTSSDVRQLLALRLSLTYSEWTPAPPKTESNGEEKPVGKTLKVKKEKAINLLICLGKTDARTWDDAKLKKSLENIVSLGEEGQAMESTSLQKLYDRLYAGYSTDIKVELVKED